MLCNTNTWEHITGVRFSVALFHDLVIYIIGSQSPEKFPSHNAEVDIKQVKCVFDVDVMLCTTEMWDEIAIILLDWLVVMLQRQCCISGSSNV